MLCTVGLLDHNLAKSRRFEQCPYEPDASLWMTLVVLAEFIVMWGM
jgi:hypothetical protein